MWCIAPLFSDVSHEDDLIEISARHRHLLEWDTWTQKPKAGFSETRVQLTDMRPWLTNWDPPLQGEMLIKHLEKTEKFLLAWKLKLFLPCMPLASMFPLGTSQWLKYREACLQLWSFHNTKHFADSRSIGLGNSRITSPLPPPTGAYRAGCMSAAAKRYKVHINIKLLCFERKFINLHFSTCVGSSTSDKWTLSLHFGR